MHTNHHHSVGPCSVGSMDTESILHHCLGIVVVLDHMLAVGTAMMRIRSLRLPW